MTHYCIQINKDARSEHLVDLLLAGGIASHKPLKRRRLIRGIVIDVQFRVGAQAFDYQIDEPLKCSLLICAGECPVRSVGLSAGSVLESIPK